MAFFALPAAARASHPWVARRPPAQPAPAHQLRDVNRWPAEPDSPATIDPVRFRVAVDHLCARSLNREEQAALVPVEAAPGTLVQAAATQAAVDPFLLAGLMFAQSSCKADLVSPGGYGLLKIAPALYRSEGAPPPPGDPVMWTKSSLLDPAMNLKLGAQLLKMWQDTHVENDLVFRGVPHRSAVAHFAWGDVVRGSGTEDQVMTARRRLIAFYLQTPDVPVATSYGLPLVSPLEGVPRVASSGPGEDRAGGKRRHRGIDLGAAIGEPVRAVADGTVIFAGANVPGSPKKTISPAQINRYRWRQLGPGGIYICIAHGPERHVVSCYMHLDTFTITEGDTVKAGQEIGRVGRTGVQVSPPHLHFEIRLDDRYTDPTRSLGALCIPPRATQTHRYAVQAQRTRMARARMEQQAASQKL
jgi:murein DD-endopeptidase MepM/ murein hydrolase activator NlpD